MDRSRIVSKLSTLVLFTVFLWLSSCRTAREIPAVETEVKPVSAGKLLKNIEKNAFDYDYFSIKRISCQFSSNNSNANFKINLKAQRDKKILVAISKLNIPVGRVLLTPDSVKYVNYIDKNYFVDDYSYLSSFLNIDLDFSTVQSIISNNAFSYRNDEKDKDFKTFDSYVESGMYVLQSEKTRKIFKMEEKNNPEKIERRLRKLDDEALIFQKMYFNAVNYALLKLIINDKTNNRLMNMDFDDFVRIQNKDYPGMITMNFNSQEDNLSLKIRLSGFSTEKINSFNLNIPEKYEQIRVN